MTDLAMATYMCPTESGHACEAREAQANRTLHDFDGGAGGLIACKCSGVVACALEQVAQLL